MNKYEVVKVKGEGAYGIVLKCLNKNTGTYVAIKKFKESEDDEIVRKTTLREVKILRMLRHPNIVSLLEAFRRKGKLFLVFEYVHNNLLEVLEDHPQGLDRELVKRYTFQLCMAIDWCHRNEVIHRDIKPENLLVDPDHTLKLCDFGFARTIQYANNNLTDYVATRWYRSPELLLGATSYDMSVDTWAIACIMAEMTDAQPLFPGENEIDQLYIIQQILGPLTNEQMDMFLRVPRFGPYKFGDMSRPETITRKFVGRLGKRAIKFMSALLRMDPAERLDDSQCLHHPYFEGLAEEYAHAYRHLQPDSARHQYTSSRPSSRQSSEGSSIARSRHRRNRREQPNPPSTPSKSSIGGKRGGRFSRKRQQHHDAPRHGRGRRGGEKHALSVRNYQMPVTPVDSESTEAPERRRRARQRSRGRGRRERSSDNSSIGSRGKSNVRSRGRSRKAQRDDSVSSRESSKPKKPSRGGGYRRGRFDRSGERNSPRSQKGSTKRPVKKKPPGKDSVSVDEGYFPKLVQAAEDVNSTVDVIEETVAFKRSPYYVEEIPNFKDFIKSRHK